MDEDIPIRFSLDRMIVLYDLVSRLNEGNEFRFEDQSEQRVLWDLESELERKLPTVLSVDYRSQLRRARGRIRDVSE